MHWHNQLTLLFLCNLDPGFKSYTTESMIGALSSLTRLEIVLSQCAFVHYLLDLGVGAARRNPSAISLV
jgi:hypothetical protein